MEEVPIKKAREDLAELLNFVAFGNKNFLITRFGKPMAILVSVAQWKEIQKTMSKVKFVD
jgi:prevent-host-death family protein